MKLSRHKPPGSLSFNMTPMIDIVFLLIIFFMTVSQITRTVDHPMSLPVVTMGDSQSTIASITINLDSDGKIIIGSKQLSMSNTLAAIQTKLKSVNGDPNRIKIQLRCDRLCESRHVSELLSQLSRLGFTNVRSAVAN